MESGVATGGLGNPNRSTGGLKPSPTRPQVFLVSRQETIWLIAGSRAFALVFFYPVPYDSDIQGRAISGWLCGNAG
jgi:hypothetical protein